MTMVDKDTGKTEARGQTRRTRNPKSEPPKPRFHKMRGILVVDIECKNLVEAAAANELLDDLVQEFKQRTQSKVVHGDCEIRERRGNTPLDLSKAKFRTA